MGHVVDCSNEASTFTFLRLYICFVRCALVVTHLHLLMYMCGNIMFFMVCRLVRPSNKQVSVCGVLILRYVNIVLDNQNDLIINMIYVFLISTCDN